MDKGTKTNDQWIRSMILSALCLALAYVLPFLTGQIPAVGTMLCPMHVPVLLCGFLCGWQWGLAVGVSAPLLRSLTLGAPVFFPMAVSMALELATYGAAVGVMMRVLPRKVWRLYVSLLTAMLLGRAVWGLSMWAFVGAIGGRFGWSAFLSGAFFKAIPGIVLQIVLVPAIVYAVQRNRTDHE